MSKTKIYCTHCGEEITWETETCPICHHKLPEKEHALLEYLRKNTKDDLKDKFSDKIYETVKNYLLSHLFGLTLTVTLVAAVTTGAAARSHRIPMEILHTRPESVAAVSVGAVQSATNSTANETIPPSTEAIQPPETTLPPETTQPPAPTLPTLSYDYDSQIAVIAANSPLWMDPDGYASYSTYSITDLDRDGLLELILLQMSGNGFFTNMTIYEVTPALDGLVSITVPNADSAPDDFWSPEVLNIDDEVWNIGYYDPETGIHYYLMQDLWRSGAANSGTVIYRVAVVDNTCQMEYLGKNERSGNENGDFLFTYFVGDTEVSEEEYPAAIAAQMGNMIPFRYRVAYFNEYSEASPEEDVTFAANNWDLQSLS